MYTNMVILTIHKLPSLAILWVSESPSDESRFFKAHGGSSRASVLGFAWDCGPATIGAGTWTGHRRHIPRPMDFRCFFGGILMNFWLSDVVGFSAFSASESWRFFHFCAYSTCTFSFYAVMRFRCSTSSCSFFLCFLSLLYVLFLCFCFALFFPVCIWHETLEKS